MKLYISVATRLKRDVCIRSTNLSMLLHVLNLPAQLPLSVSMLTVSYVIAGAGWWRSRAAAWPIQWLFSAGRTSLLPSQVVPAMHGYRQIPSTFKILFCSFLAAATLEASRKEAHRLDIFSAAVHVMMQVVENLLWGSCDLFYWSGRPAEPGTHHRQVELVSGISLVKFASQKHP